MKAAKRTPKPCRCSRCECTVETLRRSFPDVPICPACAVAQHLVGSVRVQI